MTKNKNNTFISYFPTKTNLDTKKLPLVFKKKKDSFTFTKGVGETTYVLIIPLLFILPYIYL